MNETIEVEREKLEEIALLLKRGICENFNPVNSLALRKLEEITNPEVVMTEADWERVVKEKFYVCDKNNTFNKFIPEENNRIVRKHCAVVREKGHRQPHFAGHPHPEGNERLALIYTLSGSSAYVIAKNLPATEWDSVREYIIL